MVLSPVLSVARSQIKRRDEQTLQALPEVVFPVGLYRIIRVAYSCLGGQLSQHIVYL